MTKNIDRREFLKFASLASTSSLPFLWKAKSPYQNGAQNVLIILFDAFSAYHMDLYGYGRETMPLFNKLVNEEGAVVYHQHFASASFTTPGTASLLTGVLPWKHGALRLFDIMYPEYETKNIFTLFEGHHRLGYSHNPVANVLLNQIRREMDAYIPRQKLFLDDDWVVKLFENDFDTASISMRQIAEDFDDVSYSLFLKNLYQRVVLQKKVEISKNYLEEFPRGVPQVDRNYFTMETAVNWLTVEAPNFPQPFMGYFHYYPPHSPYFTRHDFVDVFKDDGFVPVEKPDHPFLSEGTKPDVNLKFRRHYDEYILYIDAEFKRLYDNLKTNGILDNTMVVFTSDHGEMFERGIYRHMNITMHQPIIRVPMVIFEPGRTQRLDIYEPTSSIDILPTLLSLNNYDIPEWLKGDILPPYRTDPLPTDRSIYAGRVLSIAGKTNRIRGSLMLVKGKYKLSKYADPEITGEETYYELFDLENDPDEINDLINIEQEIAGDMIAEIETMIAEI